MSERQEWSESKHRYNEEWSAWAGRRWKGFRIWSTAIRGREPLYSAASRRRCFHRNPTERSWLANAIRSQFHDRPFAVMETPFVLQASLEKNYRRETRYDLALRAILLRATAHSRHRLGKWIHDTRRLDGVDPSYYQGVTGSRSSP